ncbi:hypothetical protein ACFYY8_13160 [Streptosporangium sp. NPDC001559]|uniref:hypothetical protein n=1 Tax=Streptosporangium sp. NPDC001559 TaxID=3366187 RepID=UPI0036E36E24
MNDLLHRASGYLLLHARLLDRLRFEALFGGGSRARVLDALRGYQNADGGFGHALEPDLRGSGSQPQPVEIAFWLLDELDAFADPMTAAACDYLTGISTPEGGVPFMLPTDAPRAPWWQTDADPPANLNPTAPLAGLLHKHGVTHPWLGPATDFCWSRIAGLDKMQQYEARAVLTFLEHVPDRERALAEFTRLKPAFLAAVSLEPDQPGHVHYPLDFAPEPLRLPLFDTAVLELHLDVAVRDQADDGGWAPNWEMWTPLVQHEWGGYLTVGTLKTLRAYGRL